MWRSIVSRTVSPVVSDSHVTSRSVPGWAPPTVNLEALDPEVAASIPNVLAAPFEGSLRRILSTSFGFGGLNAALVFGSVD